MLLPSFMRMVLVALSAVFGGVGVFLVWKSCYIPQDGLAALLSLATASAITVLTPH